jgi:bleomycin hydrolase
MKKYSLDSFELSQSYVFFWDKLEKVNWFLEQIIETSTQDIDSRIVQTLLGDIVSDGGQWDMVYDVVSKYGLVPQSLYPDSWNASNSAALNTIIKTKLRQHALALRKACRKEGLAPSVLSTFKAEAISQISLIMTLLLGPPPNPNQNFKWEYNDKDGVARELETTPKNFASDIYSSEFRISSATIEGMISLVHDPRHEPLSLLSVPRLGNVVGGRSVTYVNTSMDVLKGGCISMIKAGLPVFFGCDVGKFSDRTRGAMDLDLFNYDIGINTGMLGMSKAERLLSGESQMTHAMVLTAVHMDEKTGKPVRWRVQNSWGADAGDKGWFVMTDSWMDEFVYQAVIDQRFCSKEVRDVLQKEPVVLPLWDPMGALA